MGQRVKLNKWAVIGLVWLVSLFGAFSGSVEASASSIGRDLNKAKSLKIVFLSLRPILGCVGPNAKVPTARVDRDGGVHHLSCRDKNGKVFGITYFSNQRYAKEQEGPLKGCSQVKRSTISGIVVFGGERNWATFTRVRKTDNYSDLKHAMSIVASRTGGRMRCLIS